MLVRKPWKEELAIIDDTMKAISGVTDPEDLVDAYWTGIGKLLTIGEYVALSRRGVAAPHYVVTRSSRFTEHFNPWTQRDKLPVLSGGLLGEIAYAERPVILEDLAERLRPDDPGHFYLQGFGSAVALPQYDGGVALNTTIMLFPPGVDIDRTAIPILHWQSGLFGRGTRNLVLRNQLDEALAAIDRELKAVGEIQRSLLPRELPAIPGVELWASYRTSARAGGDYYDLYPLSGGRWGVFIADVSGHGTPAAVLMAIIRAIAHTFPPDHQSPTELLAFLNRELVRSYAQQGAFVTAFYAILDPAGPDGSRRLTYSSAGHNPPRLVRIGAEGPEGVRVTGLDQDAELPMGILPEPAYQPVRVELRAGDQLVFYTDGITEAPAAGAAYDQFGTDRLDAACRAAAGLGPRGVLERIEADVGTYTADAPLSDDRTMLAMRLG